MPIKNLKDLQKAVDKVAPAFEALAVTAAVAFGELAKHAIETADEMGKFAQKAGVTTEAFSSLAYGAELFGVDAGGLSRAFKELSKNISEAQVYGSPAAKMFEQLGIAARGANGEMMSADQVLLKLATSFADHADGVNKTTTAVKLFGRAGQEMIPFLNQGANGIKQMQEEAGVFHQIFSGPAAKSAEDFTQNLSRIKKAIEGVVVGVVTEFLPASAEMLGSFVEWIRTSGIVEGAVNALVDVFKVIGFIVKNDIIIFSALSDVFVGIADTIAHLASSVVDFFALLGSAAGRGSAIFEEVVKGNFQNAEVMAKQAFAAIQTDALNFLREIPAIGAAAAAGFTNAFSTLKGLQPFPKLFDHGAGTPENPINVAKPGMSNPDTAPANPQDQLLPSGFTWQAYQLDQDMMIKTQAALLDLNSTKMTLADRQRLLLSMQTAEEQKAFDNRMEQITNLRLEDGENYSLVESAYAEHAARMKKITGDMAKGVSDSHLKMFDAVAGTLGSLATLAQAFGKKGFLAYQAFSIGQAIVSTALGVTRALGAADPPLNFIMAAAVAAAGAAQIATIVAQKPPQAHAGATMIPEEATYLLQGGERVLAPEQNQDLTQFLAGGGMTHVQVNLDGREIANYIGQASRSGFLQINARSVI
jgi:hypothetical protein